MKRLRAVLVDWGLYDDDKDEWRLSPAARRNRQRHVDCRLQRASALVRMA